MHEDTCQHLDILNDIHGARECTTTALQRHFLWDMHLDVACVIDQRGRLILHADSPSQ